MNPNFFIVGAPKSGTTNISYYLKLNKKVFMPENLEPYYFARIDVPKNYERPIIKEKEKYLKLFNGAKNCDAIGESSPVYLYCPHSAVDIKKQFPNSKIIISLRNLIEIVYSMYYSLKFMKFENRNFQEVLDTDESEILSGRFSINNLLGPGFYSKHIKWFQEIFPSGKIKIVIFEEYIQNIEITINSILSFLDIDESTEFSEQPKGAYKVPRNKTAEVLLENRIFRKIAQSIIPEVTRSKIGDRFFVKESKKPPMNLKDRERLKHIFNDDVKNVKKLLNKDLP